MRTFAIAVFLAAAGIFLGLHLPSCATTEDLKEFSAVQEKGDLAIAKGFQDLAKGVITPAQAEEIVTKTVAKKNAETDQKIEKLEDRVLAWWQVICAGVASAIPVAYGAMKLLNRSRNNSRRGDFDEWYEERERAKGRLT